MRRVERGKKLITQNDRIQLNTEIDLPIYVLKTKILNATVL